MQFIILVGSVALGFCIVYLSTKYGNYVDKFFTFIHCSEKVAAAISFALLLGYIYGSIQLLKMFDTVYMDDACTVHLYKCCDKARGRVKEVYVISAKQLARRDCKSCLNHYISVDSELPDRTDPY